HSYKRSRKQPIGPLAELAGCSRATVRRNDDDRTFDSSAQSPPVPSRRAVGTALGVDTALGVGTALRVCGTAPDFGKRKPRNTDDHRTSKTLYLIPAACARPEHE